MAFVPKRSDVFVTRRGPVYFTIDVELWFLKNFDLLYKCFYVKVKIAVIFRQL